MKSKSMIKYLFVAATVGILFSSCKKKTDDTTDSDTSAATDNALAEGTYNDVHNISDQAINNNVTSYMVTSSNGEKGICSTCVLNITIDSTSGTTHTMTITFGNGTSSVNCLCQDGRYRRGTINVSWSGHYRDAGSTHTISFTNYFVNDNQVMGTKTVTNNGYNTAGHLTFSISVNGTIIKANNGGTITWTSSRTREWIAGESTPTWGDDEYLITGTASGTNSTGASFTAAITNAIDVKLSCRFIVAGTFTITPAGKPTRTFDFGNGACDDLATVTINGNVYNITLH